jgi:hypothetical protein
MTYWRESDLDRLIAATGGVDVTVGATTVKGHVDIVDESVLQGLGMDIAAEVTQIMVKTGAFASLVEGTAITADGVVYTILRSQRMDDGALTLIHVARA